MSATSAASRARPGLLRAPSSELSLRQYGWAMLTVAVAILPHAFWLAVEAVAVPLAFLAFCWWRSRRSGQVSLVPDVAKLLLIVLLSAIIVGRYGTLFGRLPGASLLVTMLALKAVECRKARDVRVMVSIAFFVIVAAFLFNDSPLLVLYMFAAAGLGFAAMEALEQRPGEHSLLFARLGWRQVVTLLLVSLPLTLVLWLFFPRISTPFWGTPEQAGKTGLSNRMKPGDITELLSDDTPVLRVTFQGPTPPRQQLYFRGPTLWYFDGAEWSGDDFMPSTRRPFATRVDLRYEVYQEATERRWLFALDRPATLSVDARWTYDRQLLSEQPLVGALSYTVGSQLSGPFEAERMGPRTRAAMLQLPNGFDPRTRELGRKIRAGADAAGESDRQIVAAVLDMFTEQEFFYSLSPPPLGRNRMDEFLFETRTGFCEHYASAFVGLMRAANVPARVVTGYQGGVDNAAGGYLTVRNSDAHAWTEVWLDGDWERIDPTAAIAPERISQATGAGAESELGFWESVEQRWDALGQYWRNFVVQFNALKQMQLLRPFGIEKADWEQLGAALAIFGAITGALAGWLLWRQRPPLSRDPWQRGWRLLRSKLQRAGVRVSIAAGPRSLLGAAAQTLDTRSAAATQSLLDQFEAQQYARKGSPDPALGRGWLAAVRKLRLRRRTDGDRYTPDHV